MCATEKLTPAQAEEFMRKRNSEREYHKPAWAIDIEKKLVEMHMTQTELYKLAGFDRALANRVLNGRVIDNRIKDGLIATTDTLWDAWNSIQASA